MIKNNASSFWSFVKNRRKSDTEIPSTVHWNDFTADNGQKVCDLFASFFKSTYLHDINNNQTSTSPSRTSRHDVNLSELNVSYDDVYKQLRKLDSKKGAGPDKLPNQFLRNCAAGLAEAPI